MTYVDVFSDGQICECVVAGSVAEASCDGRKRQSTKPTRAESCIYTRKQTYRQPVTRQMTFKGQYVITFPCKPRHQLCQHIVLLPNHSIH